MSDEQQETYQKVGSLLETSIKQYLQLRGIPVVEEDQGPSRQFSVLFNGIGACFCGLLKNSRYFGTGGMDEWPYLYLMVTTEIEVSPGTVVVREQGLPIYTLVPGPSNAESIARTLAEVIVDDALTIWHPAKSVIEETPPRGYSLLPVRTEDAVVENTRKVDQISHEQPATFEWEMFPSERLLAGSDLSILDISDVRYDLMIFHGGRYIGSNGLIFNAIDLTEPRYGFEEPLPYCSRFSWSVRARFKHRDQPRMTAWSGRVLAKIEAPVEFVCKLQRYADLTFEPTQLDALEAGDKLASIILTGSRCGIDEDACSAKAYSDNNRLFRRKFQKELRKFEKNLEVVNGVDLVSRSPNHSLHGPPHQMDLADFQAWMSMASTRDYLLQEGISQVVAIHSETEETFARSSSSNDVSDPAWFLASSSSYSHLLIHADVLDVATGSRKVRLNLIAEGEERLTYGMFLIIPFAYTTDVDAFEEGVEDMSQSVAFVLMGGRTGWPKGFDAIPKGLVFRIMTLNSTTKTKIR